MSYNLEYARKARDKSNKKKREFLIQLKELRGGKCENCGYDKNYSCLEFHHITNNKKFRINGNYVRYYSKETIMEEVIKCKLLCSNCHSDLHNPHLRK